ncbi:hypothetical protein BLNAU_1816 [Blattamonas nauphoetae]|uniref:Uncharacterized protein n=1 Tax=Blattamonas nauphoetae TaxID=2049346 RepID=A0ABQ9YHP6_9EUKA|nr:hypothetical protein BLNAU_1816 [Blattamonas nauphoetae]
MPFHSFYTRTIPNPSNEDPRTISGEDSNALDTSDQRIKHRSLIDLSNSLNVDDASMSSLSLVIPTQSTPSVTFSPAMPNSLHPTPISSLARKTPEWEKNATDTSKESGDDDHHPRCLTTYRSPARSPTPVAHRIFQAAGLMPLNQAAEWLPNHTWKNALTLAAIPVHNRSLRSNRP